MLRSVAELTGFGLLVEDGKFGKVRDLFFNLKDWTISHLVINTGYWFFGRQVLIPIPKIGVPDWRSRLIPVSLTKKQIKYGEGCDGEMLVSNQQQNPSTINELIGYRVYAKDGEVGRVEDIIFEQDETWLVRSLVVKIRNRFYSKKVVIASLFVELISFGKSAVYLNLIGKTLMSSPEFNREEHVNRELDKSLHDGSAVNLSRPYEQDNN